MDKDFYNKIDALISNAIKNISKYVSTNNVIGDAIIVNEITIIPISKITTSFLIGGGEYGDIKKTKNDYPYSGASGGIVSTMPLGFLVCDGKNSKLIALNNDFYDKLYSFVDGIYSKINPLNKG